MNHYLDLIYSKPGKRPSLHRLVLEAFIEGDQLSVVSALQKYRTIELRKIVSDLRHAGIPVSDRWQVTPSKKRYKIYFLSENNDRLD